MITLRLLNDTVLTSLIRGIAMGLVAHFIGGFVFLPIFLIGAFWLGPSCGEVRWCGYPSHRLYGDGVSL